VNAVPDQPHPSPEGPHVAASRSQGVQVGNNNVQYNFFAESRALHWPYQIGVIPRLADCYQPREHATKALAEIEEGGGATVVTQVLSGLGGVGKTQLAAAHVRRQQDTRAVDLLVWVNANSRDAILTSYAQAAREIGDTIADDIDAAAEWFVGWLQTTERSWLVVLDDLTDPAHLRGLWPDGPNGHALVTTRRTDAALFGHGRRRIPVAVFTPTDAHAYLAAKINAAPGSDQLREADQLAVDLGHLPLALAQAAAFILDHDDTCAGYRTRLRDRRRQLAELFPDDALADDYQHTVAATWSISLDAADQLAPVGLARPLLQIASVLDPNGFPTHLIDTPAVLDHLRSVRVLPATAVAPGRPEGDGQDSRDALANLARLSLIDRLGGTLAGGGAGVRVHALVQRATLEHLDPSAAAGLVRVAAEALVHIWPEIEHDPQLGQTLRSNATAVHGRYCDALWTPDVHPVLFRAGRSLGEAGLVDAALAYWTQLVCEADHHLGPDHPDTLSARTYLADRRGEAGDPAGAATAHEQLLADRLRVLGPDHPDTLTTRANIARWWGGAGHPASAVAAYEPLLSDYLRLLGTDHPATLTIRHNLAFMRGQAGDPASAATALQQLLSDCLRVVGPDHPDTLTTRSDLAYWRGEAGDPAGAVTALKQLLLDRLRVLGADHPDTLTTRASIARWRGGAGDPAGAATAFEQVVSDRLRVLGPDHPDTLTARANHARWRGLAGDPAGAATEFEQLLSDYLRVLGRDHPATLATRHNLVYMRGEAGDPADPATEFEQLLSDYLRVLGPDHPDTLATRANVARWRGLAGDPVGAAAAFEQLLADRTRVLGPDHPNTLTTRANLAHWRGQVGDPAGTATAYEQLLADQLRVLGPDHPDTLTTRHNLSYWRKKAGQSHPYEE
jgi:hypothetical protein